MPPADEYGHHNMYLMACAASGDVRATLLFVRLIERMRRATAHEYGLHLSTVLPRQTFVSRIAQSDGSRQSLHADESSTACFHYSCVLYLSSHGEHFEGGHHEARPFELEAREKVAEPEASGGDGVLRDGPADLLQGEMGRHQRNREVGRAEGHHDLVGAEATSEVLGVAAETLGGAAGAGGDGRLAHRPSDERGAPPWPAGCAT